MARHHSTHQLRDKKVKYPLVKVDHDNDFASIKLAQGIEAKSFEKDGFIFSLDAKGKVIEVQILNLSALASAGT
ncbi:MAG: DUF2283 domain-containing protein [Pseudobdellovibrionaceae bacterium]